MKRTSLLSMILVHAYLTLAHDLDTHVWSPEEQTIEFGIVRLQISLQLERNPRAKDIDELRLGNRVPFEAPDISQEGLVAVDYVSTDPGKSSFQIFYVKDDNDEFRFHSFRGYMCYSIILYTTYTILYYTILYYTILYYDIVYYTKLWYTILYYSIL